MATRRMLYSNIWESGQVSKLSKNARLLYIGTITIADDDGLLKANPSLLRSKIFPLDDDVTVANVKQWRDELVNINLVMFYEVNGEEYLYHPNWLKFQNVRNDMYRPSEFPPPPNVSLQSRNDSVTKTKQSRYSNITKHNLTQHKDIYAQTSFENFWSEYPNKVAKKKAYNVWLKINPDEELFKKIMAGLEQYKKSPQWTKDNGQYIPHPTTWLNQERWNDEVKPMKLSSTGGKFSNIGKKI